MGKTPTYMDLHIGQGEINALLRAIVEEVKARLQELEVRIIQLEKYVPELKKTQRDNAPPADQPRRRGREHMYR